MLFAKSLYKQVAHLNPIKRYRLIQVFSCVLALPLFPVEDKIFFFRGFTSFGEDGLFAFLDKELYETFMRSYRGLKGSNCEMPVDKHGWVTFSSN